MQEQIAKQSNFLSNKKKKARFWLFFPFYIKMQVLPDQFMHSVWPQGRLGSGAVVGSVWVVLKKEKLLCSPVRAASLSEECCTFYFCPHKTDSSGEKKGALSWMPRRGLTVTLRSSAAGATPSPFPSPSPPSETLTLDRMRRGCRPPAALMRASSRTEGLVVHPDPQHQSTNTQWVLMLHECLTNWRQQSCDPKLT